MQEVAEAIESISSEHRVLQKAENTHTSSYQDFVFIHYIDYKMIIMIINLFFIQYRRYV